MLDITHNYDGYTINCMSFYDTADITEIYNIKELEKLVADITERYFDNKFDVYVSDNWHYGCQIELVWNGDPLDGTMSGNMPQDFMLDRVNQLQDNFYEVYGEAVEFALKNSNHEEYVEETA